MKLAAGAAHGDNDALMELKKRVRTHERDHLNIRPEFYEFWLESLIKTAKGYDSKWEKSVEGTWGMILGFVIHRMASNY